MKKSTEINFPAKSQDLRRTIVQVTDFHLFKDESQELHGCCTHDSLVSVMDSLLGNRSASPDAILVTGDISQDRSRRSYELALLQLERASCPVYWTAGNHDSIPVLRSVFDRSATVRQLTTLTCGAWDFLSINTSKEGTDEGYISDDDIDSALRDIKKAEQEGRSVAIVMHHHPLPVDTPLVDECMLNSRRFDELINAGSTTKLIVCGHVHGDYKITFGDMTLESCPATCFQWVKGTSQPQTEDRRGFRQFIFDDGQYASSTIFI